MRPNLAIATIHKMDYLLTWNYAHMANPGCSRTAGKTLRVGCRNGAVDGLTGIDSAGPIWPGYSKESLIMPDPILDEIWRVREELLKKHGD